MVKAMGCILFDAKQLFQTLPTYYKFDPWEHISMKCTSKYNNAVHENAIFSPTIC